MAIKSFIYRLPGQRKDRRWVVCPVKGEVDTLTVQADGCIGRFDPKTGAGRFCAKGEYFAHLALLGKPFQFPPEFVKLAVQNQHRSGDYLGAGVWVG